MKTLIGKLKEPSTFRGLAILAGAAGVILFPGLAVTILVGAAVVVGLVEVVRSEKK
jgi:hypothetical protein